MEQQHIVSDFQYMEDITGVYSINRLLENKAVQLRTNSDVTTFIPRNGSESFVPKVEKGTWVTIVNYELEDNYVFPTQVVCVTNNGETFNVNTETLVGCFDMVGFDITDLD